MDREITIRLIPREDGGIRVCSDDIPGLILSGPDPIDAILDIWPAISRPSKNTQPMHNP